MEAPGDLRWRSFVATDPDDARLPRLEVSHGYTRSVYRGRHPNVRGRPRLVLAVGATAAPGDGWVADPTATPGGVGVALGYYDTRALDSFAIVHVHVNPPYRKGPAGASQVSTWVLESPSRPPSGGRGPSPRSVAAGRPGPSASPSTSWPPASRSATRG